jgi:hypothetical protein
MTDRLTEEEIRQWLSLFGNQSSAKSVTFVALAAEVLEHRVEIERLRAENAELRRTLADEIERLRAYVRPM